jgi:hypothetical protein
MPLDTPFDLEARDLCIAQVVSLLVQGKYRELEWLSRGVHLGSDALEKAVTDYGRTLAAPLGPRTEVDFIRIDDSSLPAWSANVPLFTEEEGRSDLTLTLTIRQDESGRYRVEIDDLHVL